jgi:hypothetical protein
MTDAVVIHRVRTKYHWPALQLNFWLLIMIIGSATIMGIFSYFVTVQQQLQVGTPWLVSLPLTPPDPSLSGARRRHVGDVAFAFQC